MLPDYFFDTPAALRKGHHPLYALGEGGLVRHTKAAVNIENDLLNLEMYGKFNDEEKDLIIASLILHDGKKHGDKDTDSTYAVDHPLIVANWIKDCAELNSIMIKEFTETLTDAISSHMGQWVTDFKTKKVILPKPKTSIQKFVHQCDYLASRKYLIFDFGEDYYKPENFKENEGEND
jgi:hypothetical protein